MDNPKDRDRSIAATMQNIIENKENLIDIDYEWYIKEINEECSGFVEHRKEVVKTITFFFEDPKAL